MSNNSQLLKPSDATTFLARFIELQDGVVRWFEYKIGEDRSAKVMIECLDIESPTEWSMLELMLEGISEFRLIELRSSCACVSIFGAQLLWDDNSVFVCFDPTTDYAVDVDTIRASDFYIRARAVYWNARPSGDTGSPVSV